MAIYLDYNATAPLCYEAYQAASEAFSLLGNPSSVHGFGRVVRQKIETARQHIADFLGVSSQRLVFTSGATESNNLASQEMTTETERIRLLSQRLYAGITQRLSHVYLNGDPVCRIPGNLNLSFAYVEGEGLMMGIKELSVSSGSACTSSSLEPSYVLRALGVDEELAHTSIRFGMGGFSFGAWIGMQLLMRRPELEGFISVSPPANLYDFNFLAPCPVSGQILQGTADTTVPHESVSTLIAKLRNQKGIRIDYQLIEGCDHFFTEHLSTIKTHVDAYLSCRLEPFRQSLAS